MGYWTPHVLIVQVNWVVFVLSRKKVIIIFCVLCLHSRVKSHSGTSFQIHPSLLNFCNHKNFLQLPVKGSYFDKYLAWFGFDISDHSEDQIMTIRETLDSIYMQCLLWKRKLYPVFRRTAEVSKTLLSISFQFQFIF